MRQIGFIAHDAIDYIRRMALANPEFDKKTTIVDIVSVGASTLYLDLDDGTTVVVTVGHYRRSKKK